MTSGSEAVKYAYHKGVQLNRLLLATSIILTGCGTPRPMPPASEATKFDDRHDHHSYASPDEVRVREVALDLDVSFTDRTLSGTATLTIDRAKPESPLILDTRALDIRSAEASKDGAQWHSAAFQLGTMDPILGSPLTVTLSPGDTRVRIGYRTIPAATGLQWLTPPQTAGKQHPFLYSQSQAIHARSWIPLQDSPGVRVTYSARIRTPKDLRAVMSARNDHNAPRSGEYRFEMPQAIPPYLIALAVGNLEYQATSKRSGVYAEPSVVAGAASELADTEKMIVAAEKLYGPYRWEQYDILILPPSFPYGGMENPRLTFATPTILAGDKSLVNLIAHELAHSWSGNLVTNATWRDFWLNEGFTTYFENRIQEAVYGKDRSEMEALLEKQELEGQMKSMKAEDQMLYVDLKGRDPDDGSTQIPYVKGMLFLRRLEEVVGREKFDAFLKSYFDAFAFRSIVTSDFVTYLNKNLNLGGKVNIDEWLSKPGFPSDTPQPKSEALNRAAAATEPVKDWTTAETLHYLRGQSEKPDAKRMAELDKSFHFTQSGNSEIQFQWLLMSIRAKYAPASKRLEQFLTTVGRRKFIRPLYQELIKTPQGRAHANAIYAKARAGYHPIAQASIDEVLKKK